MIEKIMFVIIDQLIWYRDLISIILWYLEIMWSLLSLLFLYTMTWQAGMTRHHLKQRVKFLFLKKGEIKKKKTQQQQQKQNKKQKKNNNRKKKTVLKPRSVIVHVTWTRILKQYSVNL